MSLPDRPIFGSGPAHAQLMIIGPYPAADDIWKGYPYAKAAGEELTRLLHEAGWQRTSSFITYAWKRRPTGDTYSTLLCKTKKDAEGMGCTIYENGIYCRKELIEARTALIEEIKRVQPKAVLLLGDLPLWMLFGEMSSAKWRGSMLRRDDFPDTLFIPTHTPQEIFTSWDWRQNCVRDMQRAVQFIHRPDLYAEPQWQFSIRPSFNLALATLHSLLELASKQEKLPLSVDIETIARHTACVSIAWSVREAICIPLMDEGGVDYWSVEEEMEIILLLRALLTHPSVQVIGQNFNYDNQYFARYWGFASQHSFDTLIAQHVLFPGTPKDLAMLASLYCHHYTYWKDELEDYKKMPSDVVKFWTYNCKDTCYTFEIALAQQEVLAIMRKTPQFDEQMDIAREVFKMMLRGIAVNQPVRSEVAFQLMEAIKEYDGVLAEVVGHELNTASPKQMKEFFYEELGQPIQVKRGKGGGITCDAKALDKLKEKEPLLGPLIDLISTKRSLGVFLNTFCLMRLDPDGRMRCSFNTAGTETFRFSSSENAFGAGGNLQNLSAGEEEE